MNKLVEQLQLNNWVNAVQNVEERIKQELQSLEQCKKREDYLGLYDYGMRYCFLFLLQTGYDIDQKHVHKVFTHLLNSPLLKHNLNIEAIVKSRHTLKHHRKIPTCVANQELNEALILLKNLVTFKQE